MSKYIQIRNTGEIEPEGFKLLGASTKRQDENKIGFFGSGIKYTVSYLLRNNLFFGVYSGVEEIKFTLKETSLRGQEFNQIVVNGEETSVTTDWGAHWKRWQIFREIVTNAFDEEMFEISLTEDLNPVKGLTSFYLNYEDFKEYYDNLDKYFRPELINTTESSIIIKDSPSYINVFKKGVRVIDEEGYGKEDIISLFDYNLPDIDLNEERVASLWEVKWNATDVLTKLNNKEHLKVIYDAILDNRKDIFEVQEVFANISEYRRLSGDWLEVLNQEERKVLPDGHKDFLVEEKGEEYIKENKISFVPTPFVQTVKKSFGEKFTGTFKNEDVDEDFIVIEKTLSQQSLINEGIQALKGKGISFDFDVEIAKFRNKEVKTIAKNATVYISDEVLNSKLLTDCVSLLIEGYIKDRYKVKDNSKEMQSACFEVLTGLIIN